MKNLTFRQMLSIGFAAPLLVIALLAGAFFNSLANINRLVAAIADDNIPGLTLSNQLMKDALSYRVLTMQSLLNTDPAEVAAINAKCDAIALTAGETLKRYEATIASDEERALFLKVGPTFDAYRAIARKVRQLGTEGRDAEALAISREQGGPAFIAYQATVQDIEAYNQRALDAGTAGILTTMTSTRGLVIVLASSALVFALLAGVLITRKVNLTVRGIAGILDENAAQVTSAASEVSTASQSLAAGASEQAASLEETSASIEELSSMTKRNADSAQQTKDLSNQTRIAADTCATDMQAMKAAMDEIKSSSADIAKIIKTIDEIAFQTNILALNAAVEAARAGESGMGFAVVADEVRSLAQRSAQSAKETAAKIEVAIAKSEHGVTISGKVAVSLGQIVDKARSVDQLVAQIATASHEQSQGITQVNTTVGQMDKVTQSNAGSAEETAAAAEELTAQAISMQEAVASLRRLVEGAKTAQAHPTTTKRAARELPKTEVRKKAGVPEVRRPVLASSRNTALTAPDDDLHFADIKPTDRLN